MWTSVSAIADAGGGDSGGCLRRWWFKKVVKMPERQRAATIFGDVGHAVWDRFYRADDRGLVNGVPVDLYPEGWMTMCNRFDKTKTQYTVTPEEAALIKILIQKGIDEGVAVRAPGRVVEKEISSEILRVGYAKVILRGFIDLDLPAGLEDHKFLKDKKWAKSIAKLKKDIQMMGYSYNKILKGHRGNIWICHNNFIKDFEHPLVIKRSVEVTEIEIRQFFAEEILPIVRTMLDLYLRYPKTLISKWRDIPSANNAHQECNYHFGRSCPFIGICTSSCSIDSYLRPFGLTVNKLVGPPDETKERTSKMENNLISTIKTESAALVAAVPVATPVADGYPPASIDTAAPLSAIPLAPALAAVVTTPATVAVHTPAPAPARQEAPWYSRCNGEECVACGTNSIRGHAISDGTPCKICDLIAQREGRPDSSKYNREIGAEGAMVYTLIGSAVPVASVAMAQPVVTVQDTPAVATTVALTPITPVPVTAAPQPVIAEPTTAVPLRAATPVATLEPAPPLLPSLTHPVPSAADAEASAKAGAGTFNLLIGCTHLKTDERNIVDADALVKEVLDGISAQAGKDVSAIPHFDLMQAVDACIVPTAQMLSDNGIAIVSLIPSKGSAHARLIDGLRMYASTIIFPFAQ